MASEEHLVILKQGVECWNEWRRRNPQCQIELDGADLSQLKLNKINFERANLREARFYRTELLKANLSRANLRGSDLSEAILGDADLSGALLSDSVIEGALVRRANLSEANLRRSELIETNLTDANLFRADLREAQLVRTQALAVNFSQANFNGACIQDWHINSETNLDSVSCDYVYLKILNKERRPATGMFGEGEFTKLFRVITDTVDLIFHERINWNAFTYAFESTKNECEGAKLAVRSIENTDDGVVIVKLRVSQKSNRTTVHGAFMQGYNFAKLLLESSQNERLNDKMLEIAAKDAEIAYYSRDNSNQREQINKLFDLLRQQGEIKKLLVRTPNVQQNFSGVTYGVAGNVESGQNIVIEGGRFPSGGDIQMNNAHVDIEGSS